MAYVLDPAGRIIDATDQWLAWMGRAVDEVIGCEPADFVSPELSEKVRAQVERFISSGEIDGEHRYATKDGCVMEAALSGGRFRREDGRPGTHYVVVTDMSERNSLIRQRNDSLERANEDEKNQRHHLAALNHELRTPVSSMVAAASLLKTGLDAERQVQMIDLIADAGHHLLELVNHSLTVFKGEADRVVLDNVRTNVIEMVGSVVKACSHAYGSPDVQSVFDFAPDLPSHFWGDGVQLRRILYNVVSNAFKFTPRGTVSIRVSWEDLDQSLLKFEIQDTGIGIPPEQKSLLFKPFRQLGKSGDSKFAGSGLGMSLVKDVVALMKGTIRVESAPGAGTLVTFTARMEPCPLWRYGKRHNRSCSFCFMNADMPGWTDSLDGQLKDSSILIVEDNNVNAMLLQMMFEEVGIRQIQRTGSAEEALQMMRDGEYTFVFLDLHLPDMDGFSLVRKVHGVHEGQNPPVLIALTADTSPGIRERCQEVGMADYVAKPVELRTLRKVLMKHFLTRGQPGERNGASTRNGY